MGLQSGTQALVPTVTVRVAETYPELVAVTSYDPGRSDMPRQMQSELLVQFNAAWKSPSRAVTVASHMAIPVTASTSATASDGSAIG